jgi:hypothetical protein
MDVVLIKVARGAAHFAEADLNNMGVANYTLSGAVIPVHGYIIYRGGVLSRPLGVAYVTFVDSEVATVHGGIP